MKLNAVMSYFGDTYKVAEVAGVTRSSVYLWRKRGHVPFKKQLLLEQASNGVLKANANHTEHNRERYK